MASPQTIQPATADTYLWSSNADTNLSTGAGLGVCPFSASERRAIITFDFSANVPAGATITLATLSLYATGGVTGRTISCYRLLRTDWVATEATWNHYKGTTDWGTAGAKNTTTDISTTDVAAAASVASTNWLELTVTAQTQTARDSISGIAHFCVADAGESVTTAQSYCSSEGTTESQRPKLYIEYTVPSTFIPKCVFF